MPLSWVGDCVWAGTLVFTLTSASVKYPCCARFQGFQKTEASAVCPPSRIFVRVCLHAKKPQNKSLKREEEVTASGCEGLRRTCLL